VTRLWENVRIAVEVIWTNKLRALLTVLGNIVAVASIISVVALVQGMHAKANEIVIAETGADAFVIQRIGLVQDADQMERMIKRNPEMTLRDLEALRDYSAALRIAMARSQTTGRLSFGNTVLKDLTIEGVTGDYAWFPKYIAEEGRLLTAQEIERGRPVALLGSKVAEKLFGDANPIDQVVRIDRLHFRVVGVLRKRGAIFGYSQDEFVAVPLGAFAKLYGKRPLIILARPEDPLLLDEAMDEARSAMRASRRLRPSEEDDFGMVNAATFLDIWHRMTRSIFGVLVGVVTLSLVVGGIVIMTILLMTVTERTQEIGLRKAIGARRRDILGQILTESATLSVLGGLLGIALGFAVAVTIGATTPIPARVEFWSVALGVAMSFAVGLIFGVYPALVAARLSPMDAIRRE
jgi:putative ABC transport system permease protein